MISLGRKMSEHAMGATVIKVGDSLEDQEHYPSVYVDAGPELDKCELGDYVVLKGKVTSKRVSEDSGEDEKRVCLDIEVHELEPTEKGSNESEEEEEEEEPKNHSDAVKKGLDKASKKEKEDYE
jgi:hypothetical protein